MQKFIQINEHPHAERYWFQTIKVQTTDYKKWIADVEKTRKYCQEWLYKNFQHNDMNHFVDSDGLTIIFEHEQEVLALAFKLKFCH